MLRYRGSVHLEGVFIWGVISSRTPFPVFARGSHIEACPITWSFPRVVREGVGKSRTMCSEGWKFYVAGIEASFREPNDRMNAG